MDDFKAQLETRYILRDEMVPMTKIVMDDQEIDLSYLNIKVSNRISDTTGVLLFYAFKEIERLTKEVDALRGESK